MKIGRVSFYIVDDRVVRVMHEDGTDYVVAGERKHFPSEELVRSYDVNMDMAKIHLLRLLGEESRDVLTPIIDSIVRGEWKGE